MNRIRSIIIDDEPGSLVTLTELLRGYCPMVEVIATASDVPQGIQIIHKNNPDLVFLDIEMPYGNAFDLLNKVEKINFEIIFVTAFSHYAIQAFKYAAIDYILKPVNIADLQQAVQKVSSRINERQINERVLTMLENLKNNNNMGVQKIALPAPGGLMFEDTAKISHLKAEGSYTHIYFTGKRKELVSKTLKELEEILPASQFHRIHHSHIVNISFIKKYHQGRGGYVEMLDGTTIEVSTRKKLGFLEKLKG